MITREAIQQAASQGHGIGHLTPGQTWAAHRLAIPSERLQRPLAGHIAILLANTERVARERFFGGVQPGDTDEMIRRAHDDQHPPFLTHPLRETLSEGLAEHFPDLKPGGVDDDGNVVYRLADIAQALGVTEEELHREAERRGIADKIQSTSVHPLH